ncbi:MAG: MutS-related protein [Beijerinckiaceae bacterium]
MDFHSILFKDEADRPGAEKLEAPDFFVDLNLDQIVAVVTAGKQEYDLRSYFYLPLRDIDAITWRHEIAKDLENADLFDSITAFAQNMRTMRQHIAQAEKLHYKLQKERWFLDAVAIYCDAVNRLVHDLSLTDVGSRGLLAFREYATWYAESERFTSLREQTKKLEADLAAIDYTVLIKGDRVVVGRYDGEPDYSTQVEATFEKFKQDAVEEYKFRHFDDLPDMNHVEARILDLVAKLNPQIFIRLEEHCAANEDYLNEKITTFDREIQFYVAYLEHIAPLKKAGLNFCYPRMSTASKEVYDHHGFDLALASKLASKQVTPVCNDFHLKGCERVIIVSGPNQGGKTTFARTFGQLHYLASLGLPVPGTRAQLFLFDKLFTHFEREENIHTLRGKLQDDLVRLHKLLERATPNSIIIMNEIFTSTTLRDAVVLSNNIAAKIIAMDLLCVWVTFIEELASLSDETVSMVSTVVPENPATRTFKVIRKPADGLAYAMSIAEKYRLTYALIKERLWS